MRRLFNCARIPASRYHLPLLGGCDNVSVYGSVGYSSYGGYGGYGTRVGIGGRIY